MRAETQGHQRTESSCLHSLISSSVAALRSQIRCGCGGMRLAFVRSAFEGIGWRAFPAMLLKIGPWVRRPVGLADPSFALAFTVDCEEGQRGDGGSSWWQQDNAIGGGMVFLLMVKLWQPGRRVFAISLLR